MELLKIENLTKTIKKKKILDSISLTVNSGEIVGFLGPNGAGKTTTIKMVMGLFHITDGSINVCGHDVTKDFESAMKNVGGIVENPDLYKRLTGEKTLSTSHLCMMELVQKTSTVSLSLLRCQDE